MAVKRADDGGVPGADSQASDSRSLKRKVRINRDKDNRLLVTPGSQIPTDNEGFGDTGVDDIPAIVPDLKIERPSRRNEKKLPGIHKTSETDDGILNIISNGTSEGTIVTLNGKKLNVKIILNLII